MARFISQYRENSFDAIKPVSQTVQDANGTRLVTIDKGVLCEFQHGGLLQWEWEQALDKLNLRGLAEGEDPRHRFSVYDTELQAIINGWSPERRQEVEERLRNACGAGDMIECVKPKLPPPVANWDKLKGVKGKPTAEYLADLVRELGLEPHYCCNYERENKNRADVIEAISAVEYESLSEEEILA